MLNTQNVLMVFALLAFTSFIVFSNDVPAVTEQPIAPEDYLGSLNIAQTYSMFELLLKQNPSYVNIVVKNNINDYVSRLDFSDKFSLFKIMLGHNVFLISVVVLTTLLVVIVLFLSYRMLRFFLASPVIVQTEQYEILDSVRVAASSSSPVRPKIFDVKTNQISSSNEDTDSFSNSSITFESIRAGSEFIDVPMPSCQVQILDEHGAPLGFGIRDEDDFLVTNYHVVDGHSFVLLRDRAQNCYRIFVPSFKSVSHIDLAFVPININIWSKLGTSKAILATDAVFPCSVSISNNGKGSVGSLDTTTSIVLVSYSGSTLPGYSGAPYVSGKRIVALHVGAGTNNVAIPAYVIEYTRQRLVDGGCFDDDYVGEKNKGKTKKKTRRFNRTSDDAYVDHVLSEAEKWTRNSPGKVQLELTRLYDDPEAPIIFKGRTRMVEVDTSEFARRGIAFKIKSANGQYYGECTALQYNDVQIPTSSDFLSEIAPALVTPLAGALKPTMLRSRSTKLLDSVQVSNQESIPGRV